MERDQPGQGQVLLHPAWRKRQLPVLVHSLHASAACTAQLATMYSTQYYIQYFKLRRQPCYTKYTFPKTHLLALNLHQILILTQWWIGAGGGINTHILPGPHPTMSTHQRYFGASFLEQQMLHALSEACLLCVHPEKKRRANFNVTLCCLPCLTFQIKATETQAILLPYY